MRGKLETVIYHKLSVEFVHPLIHGFYGEKLTD